MILSLRTRQLLGIVIGTALLLATFSLVIYLVTCRTIIQHFDDSLLTTAKMLSAIIEDEGFQIGRASCRERV